MSSLLSTSRPSAPITSPDTHQTLDKMFADDAVVDSPSPVSSKPSIQASTSLQASASKHRRQVSSTTQTPISIPGRRTPPPHQHASSLASSAFALDRTISHGTPFGSHIFIPPSGAPGFSGDREWDKGFSRDWKEDAEGKDVRLSGRKETTTSILTQELADMVGLFY
jgi:hypothetical protein